MNVTRVEAFAARDEADAVVVGAFSDGPLEGTAAALDEASGGALRRAIDRGEFSGKPLELLPLWSPAGVAAGGIVLVGLGERAALGRQTALRAAGTAARLLAGRPRRSVAFCLGPTWSRELTEAAVCGAIVGCHGQDLYRQEKALTPFETLLWAGDEGGLASGRVLADGVNLARRLVNQSPQDVYPESFARTAQQLAAETGLEAEVWDESRLEAERAGALLAVARGSSRPPRLVVLRHHGGRPGDPPLAIVGKGVTFDSGGLSLKPNDAMKTMKCDMAGAATMLGALVTIARLRLSVNVIGLAGLVENMPGPAAMKLGEVLQARGGKSIEVLNTDAEGRLVLADVLDVAVEQGSGRIIDLATLTGACVVALGNDVAGLMTNDQAWCDEVAAAAGECGEAVWQLPMFADYNEHVKSSVADLKNVGEGRAGGAITAAKLLEAFVGGKPWTHADIAGPAFQEKPKPWLDAGATGAMVRTLVEVARRLAAGWGGR